MSPPHFQKFLVLMQSLPVIAVEFPRSCPTAPRAAVLPHCLAPSSPNDVLFLWKGWTDLKTKPLFRAVVPLSWAGGRMGTLGVYTAHPHGEC